MKNVIGVFIFTILITIVATNAFWEYETELAHHNICYRIAEQSFDKLTTESRQSIANSTNCVFQKIKEENWIGSNKEIATSLTQDIVKPVTS